MHQCYMTRVAGGAVRMDGMSGEREARRLLAEATQLVARQREIVREVVSAGCDAIEAEALLELLEETLRLRRESLDLLKTVGTAAARPGRAGAA